MTEEKKKAVKKKAKSKPKSLKAKVKAKIKKLTAKRTPNKDLVMIHVRLEPNEHKKIRIKAADLNLSMQDFARKMLVRAATVSR